MTPEQAALKAQKQFEVPAPQESIKYYLGDVLSSRRQIAYEIDEIVRKHRSDQECESGGESKAFLFDITEVNSRATRIFVVAKSFPFEAPAHQRFSSLLYYAEMTAEGSIDLETVDGKTVSAAPFYAEDLPEVSVHQPYERLVHQAERIQAMDDALHTLRDLYPDM